MNIYRCAPLIQVDNTQNFYVMEFLRDDDDDLIIDAKKEEEH